MAFELPALPYDAAALEPHYSANTLNFHHGKHQKSYVKKLNGLIEGTPLERKALEEIIKATASDPSQTKVFNNAAQVWNHTFFWNSMSPQGGGSPNGEIAEMLKRDLGGLEEFKDSFTKAGAARFGSGWVWLVVDAGKLKIVTTGNAETPMTTGQIPLITADVWEHAYYLDYQNRRPDYLQAFVDHLINWDFAARNIATARENLVLAK